jgi:hypothetical protein
MAEQDASGASPEADRPPFVSQPSQARRYTSAIDEIAHSLVDDDCVIFLGAGAAVDRTKADLPTGSELSEELARECGLDWNDWVSLATAAFYYESLRSRGGLNRLLRRAIDRADIEPSRTIEAVAELATLLERRDKAVMIVTTNYDQMFERAYANLHRGARPQVIIYHGALSPHIKTDLHPGLRAKADVWRPKRGQTYLYKIHGCISEAEGDQPFLVITEEDYVNFLTNALAEDKRLLQELQARMTMQTTLFVGYGLSDWNFRVIFKATAEKAQEQTSYAIQYFSEPRDPRLLDLERQRWESSVDFWKSKKVKVIDSDASLFMQSLLDRVRAITSV